MITAVIAPPAAAAPAPPPRPRQTPRLADCNGRRGAPPVKHDLPELWPLLESGRIDPSPVLTHDMPLEQGADGYDVMATRQRGSVKVALTPGG